MRTMIVPFFLGLSLLAVFAGALETSRSQLQSRRCALEILSKATYKDGAFASVQYESNLDFQALEVGR